MKFLLILLMSCQTIEEDCKDTMVGVIYGLTVTCRKITATAYEYKKCVMENIEPIMLPGQCK